MEVDIPSAASRTISIGSSDVGNKPISENNNHISDLMALKPPCHIKSIPFLENNLTVNSYIDSHFSTRTKAANEFASYDDENKNNSSTGDKNHSSLVEGCGKNGIVTKQSLSCDIICNCDGSVYLVPSSLSSKLLEPSGTLNEVHDSDVLPFPTNAKDIFFYNDADDNTSIWHFTANMEEDGSNDQDNNPHLLLCLPCRQRFFYVDSFKIHASKEHNLNFDFDLHSSKSAVIEVVVACQPSICILHYQENLSIDALLRRNADSDISSCQTSLSPSPSNTEGLSPDHENMHSGCDEHIDGEVECPKCDLMLSSPKSLGGHMSMMHSRNSCKTLKCPKCNWHYKYQETLEIHMKEKHPENDQACIYCVTKQVHPKLSRGESYMCGYKPYRCEVCNYSTTTKGNLSIHMQSDKHINNVQEMQQKNITSLSKPQVQVGADAIPVSTPQTPGTSVPSPVISHSPPLPVSQQVNKSKQLLKNTWRCDVCNYETNIARNLRIHMTSEKHAHNMLILEQNVKSMQRNMHMTLGSVGLNSGQADAATIQQLGTMFPFDPLGIVGQMEALTQNSEVEFGKVGEELLSCHSRRSRDVYGCVICNAFSTDELNQLDQHLTVDRSTTTNAEHVTITSESHYLCNLCQYKTSLKANFQLHCKTDKHVQRVQLVNHIREGGNENEWRMKYLSIPNPIHIVCNVCSYQSNSIHKMRIHALSPSHFLGVSLFTYLRRSDEQVSCYHYSCGVCNEQSSNKTALVNHVRLKHAVEMEKLCSEGWTNFTVTPGSLECASKMELDADESTSLEDLKMNSEESRGDATDDFKPRCSSISSPAATPNSTSATLTCPLCSMAITDRDGLQEHLFSSHNVNQEGASRLIHILEASTWKSKDDAEMEELFRCQTCTKTFPDFDTLCQHHNDFGHLEMKTTPSGNGYLCWKKGCNQYFRTASSLQTHFREIHVKRLMSMTKTDQREDRNSHSKCFICHHTFRTRNALMTHLEVTHIDVMNESEKLLYKQFISSSTSSQTISADSDVEPTLVIDERDSKQLPDSHTHLTEASSNKSAQPENPVKTGFVGASPIIKAEVIRRDDAPYKCNVCNTAYSNSTTLDEHLKSAGHQIATLSITRKIGNMSRTSKGYEAGRKKSLIISKEERFCEEDQPKSLIATSEQQVKLQESRLGLQMHTCSYCAKVFSSEDQVKHHQAHECFILLSAKNNRNSRAPYRKLLENFGIECVVGFLESEQQKKTITDDPDLSDQSSEEDTVDKKLSNLPPEMSSSKLACSDCGQKFSGIWVLKAHKEEEHKKILPESVTSHFGKLYKEEFDRREKQMATCNRDETPIKNPEVEIQTVAAATTKSVGKAPPEYMNKSNNANSFAGNLGNPLDIFNYPATTMAPWLSLFQLGMMPLNPMLSSLAPLPNQLQPANPLLSPPVLTSPPVTASANPESSANKHNIKNSNQVFGVEKRPRTRISDEQLKVLRQYFDINNSPSEDAILLMAGKTGLPAKVIKHWFRNTLFKERQKNKDSPYNFNNPPQTTLNIEEYEKAGSTNNETSSKDEIIKQSGQGQIHDYFDQKGSSRLNSVADYEDYQIDGHSLTLDDTDDDAKKISQRKVSVGINQESKDDIAEESYNADDHYEDIDDEDDSQSSKMMSSLGSPGSYNDSMTSKMFSNFFNSSYKFHEPGNKRANRTRFTDFQIKTLQDYFEQNAYPKDEELDKLSRMLQLPNRVIVVWFQNARQKARKVYENGPSAPSDANTSSGPLTANKSTYPCKKCGVVFSGYYELVKHQKRVCLKNNVVHLPFGNQKVIPGGDNMSDSYTNSISNLESPKLSATKGSSTLENFSPDQKPRHSSDEEKVDRLYHSGRKRLSSASKESSEHSLKNSDDLSTRYEYGAMGPKKSITPTKMVMSPDTKNSVSETHMDLNKAYSTQKVTISNSNVAAQPSEKLSSSSIAEDPFSDDDSDMGYDDTPLGRSRNNSGQSNSKSSQSKRYRTNLTNMQIHVMKHLFKDYKTPTMAECHTLGTFIGLQKRVVQVWFQNARAKEKKSRMSSNGSQNKDTEITVLMCKICNIKYSHQCSLQDHIFSAKHINKIRCMFTGKLTEVDRVAMCNADESSARHKPFISQPRVTDSARTKQEANVSSSYTGLMLPGGSLTSPVNAGNSAKDFQNQLSRNLLSAMNSMPSMLGVPNPADLLSLMYPGMLPQLPYLPGLLPGGYGPEQMGLASMYNPLDFGLPLSLLQIPQAAIQSISSKLSNAECHMAAYTHDCLTVEDLEREVSREDKEIVKSAYIDVGYACRRCQFIFPRKEACLVHQATTCYIGKVPNQETHMKIEQQQYSCRACKENMSTIEEFKLHCALESHKIMRSRFVFNNNNNDDDTLEVNDNPAAKRLKIA